MMSPGRDDVAWANYAEKSTEFTISELPCMPQMTKLDENQVTYVMNDLP